MQVTARVQPAPAAWPTLAATAELAGRTLPAPSPPAGSIAGWPASSCSASRPTRERVTIRVDYLRN